MKNTVRRAVEGTRFIIIIASVGAFLASLLALVYGLIIVGVSIKNVISEGVFTMARARLLASDLVNVIDLLLLGTVLYIAALGLYKLFVDEKVKTPSWMTINDLDDIKTKIISVAVVLLSVEFLASVVEFNGNNILQFGAAIGIVLVAMAAFLFVLKRTGPDDKAKEPDKATDAALSADESPPAST
jgi:uncharacterized membrane protein YqhA